MAVPERAVGSTTLVTLPSSRLPVRPHDQRRDSAGAGTGVFCRSGRPPLSAPSPRLSRRRRRKPGRDRSQRPTCHQGALQRQPPTQHRKGEPEQQPQRNHRRPAARRGPARSSFLHHHALQSRHIPEPRRQQPPGTTQRANANCTHPAIAQRMMTFLKSARNRPDIPPP
jgi:hypothetical protein